MAASSKNISYGEFATLVIESLAPAFPAGLALPPAFTATEIKGVVPSAVSATLRAAKAESFAKVGSHVCAQMGIDGSGYVTYPSLANGIALIDHSCYTRNLRRWISGTLPRKHKSRADFAILAACWSHAWFDPSASEELYLSIRKDIEALVCSIVPDCVIDTTPESYTIAVWKAGSQVYYKQPLSR